MNFKYCQTKIYHGAMMFIDEHKVGRNGLIVVLG
jgi:hypothetical protein